MLESLLFRFFPRQRRPQEREIEVFNNPGHPHSHHEEVDGKNLRYSKGEAPLEKLPPEIYQRIQQNLHPHPDYGNLARSSYLLRQKLKPDTHPTIVVSIVELERLAHFLRSWTPGDRGLRPTVGRALNVFDVTLNDLSGFLKNNWEVFGGLVYLSADFAMGQVFHPPESGHIGGRTVPDLTELKSLRTLKLNQVWEIDFAHVWGPIDATRLISGTITSLCFSGIDFSQVLRWFGKGCRSHFPHLQVVTLEVLEPGEQFEDQAEYPSLWNSLLSLSGVHVLDDKGSGMVLPTMEWVGKTFHQANVFIQISSI
ncbi:hypothetical protein T439DRAFT_337775 [Meredithblackwellia eburnea MCA 4105]